VLVKTKRGKRTKLMVICDRESLPVTIHVGSASPHEATLVEATLANKRTRATPKRLVADKAYDSDPLDARMREQGIDVISPHQRRRVKPKTQDGRKVCRYRRRWKVERLAQRLVTELSTTRHQVRLQTRELLGFCTLGLYSHTAEAFLRWVVASHIAVEGVLESANISGYVHHTDWHTRHHRVAPAH
jgi:Transposase DDE domain